VKPDPLKAISVPQEPVSAVRDALCSFSGVCGIYPHRDGTVPGWENLGEETITWYARFWGGVVCAARWPRDRLGYFEVAPELKPTVLVPTSQVRLDPHFISCVIELKGGAHRVYVNADGLSKDSFLKVEVLDERFKPVPGYSGSDSVPVTQSGLRQPVSWTGGEVIENLDHLIRVKVSWEGTRPEDLHLYAVYVSEEDWAGKDRP